MASTARAMAGSSRPTASATFRSSWLMMRNASPVGRVSIDAAAGLGCSVRSFSISGMALFFTRGSDFQLRRPYAFKVHEVSLYFNIWYGLSQILGRALQLGVMMFGFGASVAAKPAGQAAISAAIGVQHQDHTARSVQPDGFSDLLQHKFAVALMFRRCKALGASGNLDGVRIGDPDPLEILPEPQFEAVIEAPDNGRIAVVFFARRIEVEHFLHGAHRGIAAL